MSLRGPLPGCRDLRRGEYYTATSTGGTRRVRTRPAGLVPRASPCLIDLWTGKIVARNALETSPLSPSGKAIKARSLFFSGRRVALWSSTTKSSILRFIHCQKRPSGTIHSNPEYCVEQSYPGCRTFKGSGRPCTHNLCARYRARDRRRFCQVLWPAGLATGRAKGLCT